MILSLAIFSSVMTGLISGFSTYNSEKGEHGKHFDPRDSSANAAAMGFVSAFMPVIGIFVAACNTAWFRHGIFKFKP